MLDHIDDSGGTDGHSKMTAPALRPVLNDDVFLVSRCHRSTAMTHGTNFIPGVCILGKTYVPCSRNIHYIHS